MGERSFAGYSYGRSLRSGFFGEQFVARAGSVLSAAGSADQSAGRPARVLLVAERFSKHASFTAALARFGSDLAALNHRGIVATHSVGRDLDGTVIVVTESTVGMADVESVARSARGQLMPYTVALRLADGILAALAAAHSRGIVHGGLHPRSVLIDKNGNVLLDDFAVARALASVAAADEMSGLLQGFRGYLAPEIAMGEEPTPTSDIYAVGAILFSFFGGKVAGGVQPGRLKATTSVRRLVMRAMDTDSERRFATAGELHSALTEAIKADMCELATEEELATYSEDARESKDMHSTGEMAALRPPRRATGTGAVIEAPQAQESAGELDDLLDELGDLASGGGEAGAEANAAKAGTDEDSVVVRQSYALSSDVESAVPSALDRTADSDASDGAPCDDSEEKTFLAGAASAAELVAKAPLTADVPVVAGGDVAGIAADADAEDEATSVADPLGPSPAGTIDSVLARLGGDELDSVIDNLGLEASEAQLDDPLGVLRRAVGEETGEHSQLTQVDDLMDARRDPVSEIIALDSPPRHDGDDDYELRNDNTPLPPPQRHESGSFTRRGAEIARRPGEKSVQERAEAALDGLSDAGEAKGESARVRESSENLEQPRAVSALPDSVSTRVTPTDTAFLQRRGGIPGWVYGAITVLGLAVMFLLVWTRTDIFHPERAERKRRAKEARQAAEVAKIKAEQKRGGEIAIACNEDGAAVWLRLGRTPLDSLQLPMTQPHQLRIEFPGYAEHDVVVTAAHWTGDRATVVETLERAKPGHVVSAWPPPVPAAAARGFAKVQGLGVIHVESTPPRGEVWLLVGYTGTLELRDFEAGKRYEFKILKNGFQPGFGVIESADWKLRGSSDPGALKGLVSIDVPLEAVPSSKKSK